MLISDQDVRFYPFI